MYNASASASLTMLKPLTAWITTNCGKFFKIWEYQTTLPASWETHMQVKKQQIELYMEQQAGSELWKKYIEAVYCHPVYLSYMHAKCWAGWTQAGIKIARRNINCAVVWAFFGIALLWDWNENWPFPVLWPLLSFPNFLAYWVPSLLRTPKCLAVGEWAHHHCYLGH